MLPAPASPQHSPKRSPKRKVLHERSQSQTNRVLQPTVSAKVKQEPHLSTPFPTKPAQVLLPSSLRSQDGGNAFLGTSYAARIAKGMDKSGGSQNYLGIPSSTNADTVDVKRSVSELRDLYEGQAVSRPTTSHSTRASSKPSTAVSSPALKGQVLGEKLWAHERFFPSELDEMSSLSPPQDASFSIKKVISEGSLLPPPRTPPQPPSSNEDLIESPPSVREDLSVDPSSPNLIVLGSSSSVAHEPSTSSSSPNLISLGYSSSQDFNPATHGSSPDILPLHLSASPTLDPISPSSPSAALTEQSSSPGSKSVATSSSPNVVTLRSSSPNYVTTKYDDSPDASFDSLRTIKKRRSDMVHEQPSTSTFSTRSEQQFSSSPPNHGKSVTPASTLEVPVATEDPSNFSAQHQGGRLRAHENLQTAVESSPAPEIQYPIVAAPTTNAWEHLNVQKRAPRFRGEDPSPPRWNPHLSTIPSEREDENRFGSFHTVDTDDLSETESMVEMPQALNIRTRNAISSSTSNILEADRREATDMISDLRGPWLHNKTSGILSMLSGSSRSNSTKSFVLRRPNSSGSLNTTIRFPGWARRYYSRGPSDSFYSLGPEPSNPNLSETSRPSPAVTPCVQQSSPSSFRPRTRAGKNPRESHLLPGIGPLVSNPSQNRLSLPLDPVDPRSHWSGAEQAAIQAELQDRPPVGSCFPSQWSPHLFTDNRASGRNRWLAPSVDEKGAPAFTWRDAHMLGFVLGFVFPISWFVAAFLPLPPKPAMKEIGHDLEAGGPTLQQQLDHRTALGDEIRYANLRWWRNLNRFMSCVGLVVIAIIVSYGDATNGETGQSTDLVYRLPWPSLELEEASHLGEFRFRVNLTLPIYVLMF